MKSVLVIIVVLASVRLFPVRGAKHILGGVPAIRGEFPWMAAIEIDVIYFCGGSMISPRWILTAGHCVERFTNFHIVMGAHDLENSAESTRQVRDTTEKIIHANFDPDTNRNDIALLRVSTPFVTSSRIKSIRLPPPSQCRDTYDHQTATLSGWGMEDDFGSGPTPILKKLNLNVTTNEYCATFYPPHVIQRSQLCTNTTYTQAPCNGDSGGALTTVDEHGRTTQIGINSFDLDECSDSSPAVFTRVSSFTAWIRLNTGIKPCS